MLPSSRRNLPALLSICLLASTLAHAPARAGTNSRLEAVSLASMMEAQGNVMFALNRLGYLTSADAVSWTGNFSEQGWSTTANATLDGTPFVFAYSGLLAGTVGSDITVSFDGEGRIRNNVYNTSGVQTFSYDGAVGDYAALRTRDGGSIGPAGTFADGRTFYELAAAEIAYVARKTAAGYQQDGAVGALTEGLTGARVAIMLSNIVIKFGDQGPVVPPPLPGPPPNLIPETPPVGPNIQWFLGNGGNDNVDMYFDNVTLHGTFSDGVYVGTISAVPEPATWTGLLAGVLLVGYWTRKRA